MSEDSLIDDEGENLSPSNPEETSSTTVIHLTMNRKCRSTNLNDHLKLVKQKKEEADELRLQRFQEQLRKKEQKWQQQQIERVKKWLQLRNRDIDHRSQVEERRKKREEEAKAKFDEIVRREKEREQRTISQNTIHLRGNASQKGDSVMSLSTDILSTRRAISAPRIRSNYQNMTHRRESTDSPITTVSQDTADNSATAISSHQLNPNDEHRYHHRQQQQHQHRSRHSHDVTRTNEESSLSGRAQNRTRPMPTSYAFWLNTGDNNNPINANFMRSTYAASCRARLSRSVERCPRACRVHDEEPTNTTKATTSTTTTMTTNGESSQRRVQSVNRQHLDETFRRLSKPKNISMTQSTHPTTASNGMSFSQSSHQLRVPTPPVPTTNHIVSTASSSITRRQIHSRPATAPSHPITSNHDSRASPSDELTTEQTSTSSSTRPASHRTGTQPKLPTQSGSKPPVSSSLLTRSKPSTQRSLMTTSHSSSLLSSPASSNKQNIRRIGGTPSSSKSKPISEILSSVETPEQQTIIQDDHEEEKLPVNENTEAIPVDVQPSTPPIEPINIDTVTEILNPPVPSVTISKREQQLLDEQEYQRKLNQKIREAQQRLEAERQQEEERQRQLELEEYEREQEQIRLVEEQRRAEQERLQRAIEECERENELKRQEEQRLQQQREELERKQAEETERLNRERQERAKKEEEDRIERKKRLDLIMRRTRQVSPSPKPENNTSKTNTDETNGHDQQQQQQQSSIPHSNSDNRFPTSVSTDNFLTNNDSPIPETPKFKSPLIQSLLNKARNTRSNDNLSQSTMSTSQLMTESMMDEGTTTVQSINRTELSDDDDQQDSGINNTTNGHSDSPLSSSTNFNSYHDHPIETTTASP